jgi:hypothetical protein
MTLVELDGLSGLNVMIRSKLPRLKKYVKSKE